MAEDLTLGSMLKSLLKERSLSMRKLSALTGIDTATISRIINGKQQARPKHLQQIASCLGVPTDRLFGAAGFDVGKQGNDELHSDFHTSVDQIQKILSTYNLFNQEYTMVRVKKELANYEQYALTEEGQRIIIEDFQEKVKQVGGVGPFIEHLKQMHTKFLQGNVTKAERAILGSALLYFILSTDIIPDYVFPIGYLDDAIAVQLVLNRLSQINNNSQHDQDDESS